MDFIFIVTVFFVGLWVGYFICLRLTENIVGTLRVDRSDPDGPYLFLELSENINKVINREYIALKVEIKDYISRD